LLRPEASRAIDPRRRARDLPELGERFAQLLRLRPRAAKAWARRSYWHLRVVHVPEQHWLAVRQSWPAASQPHLPLLQPPVQHWGPPSPPQAVPFGAHGVSHLPATQLPEQHPALDAHPAPSTMHPAGTHWLPTQLPEQQPKLAPQMLPLPWQPIGPQTPKVLQSDLQQSDVCLHVAPSAAHAIPLEELDVPEELDAPEELDVLEVELELLALEVPVLELVVLEVLAPEVLLEALEVDEDPTMPELVSPLELVVVAPPLALPEDVVVDEIAAPASPLELPLVEDPVLKPPPPEAPKRLVSTPPQPCAEHTSAPSKAPAQAAMVVVREGLRCAVRKLMARRVYT
jgi:hypothetical protein